jgi:threonine/homoserine/homoserine lactone efflux protein
MPDPSTLAVVALASLALAVVPGPAVLYIVTRSLSQGRAAGIVSVAGIHVGTLVHVTAAAIGLSALLMRSALAFNLVKYAGAVYLVYLGVRMLSSMRARASSSHPRRSRYVASSTRASS